jgi:5-methylcytosine-specific restriction enzyme A
MSKPDWRSDRRYHTRHWRRRAQLQLRHHPLCAACAKRGRIVPATVADHITAVKDDPDPNGFWLSPLQSLCAHCHSSHKQTQEKLGYDPTIGVDGLPIDKRHPAYQPHDPFTRKRARARP